MKQIEVLLWRGVMNDIDLTKVIRRKCTRRQIHVCWEVRAPQLCHDGGVSLLQEIVLHYGQYLKLRLYKLYKTL